MPFTGSRPIRPTTWRCRWNCKAGKCGSCSAEINGNPKLMCMTRLNERPVDNRSTVEPMQGVSADQGSRHGRLMELPRQAEDQDVQAAPARRARRNVADAAGRGRSRPGIPKVHRVLPVSGRLPHPSRPPLSQRIHRAAVSCLHRRARDAPARHRKSPVDELKDKNGIGYCNITKCCTKVCPEHITITDNAIIPLKERVVDEFYDPLGRLLRVFRS